MNIYTLRGDISDIKLNDSNINWVPWTIRINSKNFLVLRTSYKDRILIKPNTQKNLCKTCKKECNGYHSFEYEKLFNFSCHCSNFDKDKIIDITDAVSN